MSERGLIDKEIAPISDEQEDKKDKDVELLKKRITDNL